MSPPGFYRGREQVSYVCARMGGMARNPHTRTAARQRLLDAARSGALREAIDPAEPDDEFFEPEPVAVAFTSIDPFEDDAEREAWARLLWYAVTLRRGQQDVDAERSLWVGDVYVIPMNVRACQVWLRGFVTDVLADVWPFTRCVGAGIEVSPTLMEPGSEWQWCFAMVNQSARKPEAPNYMHRRRQSYA